MKIERKLAPQDVTWFLDLNNNRKLDLDPAYQRKSVWNNSDRDFFLDTVVNNVPCHPIFIHKDIDDKGLSKYRVIDANNDSRLFLSISFLYLVSLKFTDRALRSLISAGFSSLKTWNLSATI